MTYVKSFRGDISVEVESNINSYVRKTGHKIVSVGYSIDGQGCGKQHFALVVFDDGKE